MGGVLNLVYKFKSSLTYFNIFIGTFKPLETVLKKSTYFQKIPST